MNKGESDLELAIRIARTAGERLLALRRRAIGLGLTPQQVKDAGDAGSQEYIDKVLKELRPLDAVLSEEAADDPRRLVNNRVWIIDPLDGTREFSEGRHDWAVHVALWEDGALSTGAVALPGLGLVVDSGCPALLHEPLQGPIRLAVSRSRASNIVVELGERLGAAMVPMGSAGFKVAAVIRGEADAYVHSGGQYEWDSAAPVAVAASQGLHVSRIDGSALAYNQRDPYLPDVLVCRRELAATLLREINHVRQRVDPLVSASTRDGVYLP